MPSLIVLSADGENNVKGIWGAWGALQGFSCDCTDQIISRTHDFFSHFLVSSHL